MKDDKLLTGWSAWGRRQGDTLRARVMAAALLVIVACMLAGCGQAATAHDAVLTYSCSAQQMQKAEQETLFCRNSADYTATFCYGAAITRNCEPKKEASK